MISSPNQREAFVASDGTLTKYGLNFLNALVMQANGVVPTNKAPESVTVGASPYVYSPALSGRVAISGGTVSQIELNRRGSWINVGGVSGVFSVQKGDQLRVTYTSAPIVDFMPD